MFTGIIQDIGVVKSINLLNKSVYIEIKSKLTQDLVIGASIAVNGVCQTVIKINEDLFTIQAVEETLRLTNFSYFKTDTKVNLELALQVNDRLDGHIVSGHVDCVGEVVSDYDVKNEIVLFVKYPLTIDRYIAYKGSITINGVSLTVSSVENGVLGVSLIKHTLNETNLSLLIKGDRVNLEVDLLARYLNKLMKK